MTKTVFNAGLASAVLLTAVSAQAVTIGKTGDTTITMGGYVKLDMLWSDWSGGIPTFRPARDFYVPSTTPVGSSSNENRVFDMHAKQSRINFGTETVKGDNKFKSFFEFDFQLAEQGDERISNSYNPRLRHAFFSYNNWLFGQTWSTFMNVGALPESVDFIGNTDGTIFVRQAMVRYTRGPWMFSIENPETTITPNGATPGDPNPGSSGTRIVSDDNEWPDFVARYNMKAKNLDLVVAGLLRQLTFNNLDAGGSVDDSEIGWGISVTGKYVLGNKDDIRFGANAGGGIGRYLALNAANDAIVNDTNNTLEAIDSMGLFASWRHLWNQKWRSNFIYSRLDVDNNVSLSGTNALSETWSARANLMFDWAKNTTLGGEITTATRENESGADGDLTRLQFMAMYKF